MAGSNLRCEPVDFLLEFLIVALDAPTAHSGDAPGGLSVPVPGCCSTMFPIV
jgi:hypothetical protein